MSDDVRHEQLSDAINQLVKVVSHNMKVLQREVRNLSAKMDAEPCVMRIDDIKLDEVYWIEIKGIPIPYPVAFENRSDVWFNEWSGEIRLADGYGKTWRVWTKRAKPSQMMNIPWEDDA